MVLTRYREQARQSECPSAQQSASNSPLDVTDGVTTLSILHEMQVVVYPLRVLFVVGSDFEDLRRMFLLIENCFENLLEMRSKPSLIIAKGLFRFNGGRTTVGGTSEQLFVIIGFESWSAFQLPLIIAFRWHAKSRLYERQMGQV